MKRAASEFYRALEAIHDDAPARLNATHFPIGEKYSQDCVPSVRQSLPLTGEGVEPVVERSL
jgi:hypothetical protein